VVRGIDSREREKETHLPISSHHLRTVAGVDLVAGVYASLGLHLPTSLQIELLSCVWDRLVWIWDRHLCLWSPLNGIYTFRAALVTYTCML